MSLMSGIAIATVFVSLAIVYFLGNYQENLLAGNVDRDSPGRDIVLANTLTILCLLLAVSVWPMFVLNGLVESSLGVTVSMQAGIIALTYYVT